MSGRRISDRGRIDRSRSISFRFDGKSYSGYAGDTLASALLANGVTLFGRSFKYHRPRGVLTAGIDEPNALVTVIRNGKREANIPATQLEIHDGLVGESQNRFPSLAFDVGAVNQLAGPIFSAGFYYKTFMGPVVGPLRGTRFWMFCEWFIRRAAGLGRADHAADTSRYQRMNAHCDVLVVGSGPAGLAAARAAADAGKNVILAELDPVPGGSAKWSGETINGRPAAEWASGEAEALSDRDNVRLLTRTHVWGYYDGNTLAALERVGDHLATATAGAPRHRHWVIRAGTVVLATGAFERPIVFPGNDRPGVMLASAAQRYAAEFGVLPGKRIALLTNNDSAYVAAAELSAAGADIAAIVDTRQVISSGARDLAAKAGGELLLGQAVSTTSGGKALTGVTVQRLDPVTGTASGEKRTITADCLAMSGGWSPAIHLASQAGAAPKWNEDLQAFLPPDP
ncbi:MAG: FAD-dependent oxidoreductase, partial [Brucellaceae bacterium]|nr:FAD-dependent oxidoreductase [Brucellaceae bacterium]